MKKSRAGSSEEISANGLISSGFYNTERNPFVCSRCRKAFPTTQALGGHQNAHRKQRLEERRAKERHKARACGEPQMIDFWASYDQLQQSDTAASTVNNYQIIMPDGGTVMVRDFMGVTATTEKEDFPVVTASSATYSGGGGDYASHHELLTSMKEMDLTLKL